MHILHSRLLHVAPVIAQYFYNIKTDSAFNKLRISHARVFEYLDEDPSNVPEQFNELRNIGSILGRAYNQIQHQLTEIRGERDLRALLSTSSARVRAKIRSSGGQGAGYFIFSAPVQSAKTLPDCEWLAAMKFRLHVPLLPEGSFICPGHAKASSCRAPFDRWADHTDGCRKFQGAWTAKSTAMELFIVQCCKEARLKKVQHTPFFPAVGRPDISAEGWGQGGAQQLIVEVAVATATQEGADENAFAAKAIEKVMLAAPRGQFFCNSPAHDFRPFIVETGGRLGPHALTFLQELAEVVAQQRDSRL